VIALIDMKMLLRNMCNMVRIEDVSKKRIDTNESDKKVLMIDK